MNGIFRQGSQALLTALLCWGAGERASRRMQRCAAGTDAIGAGSSRGLGAGMAAGINAFQQGATRSVVTS